MTVALARVLGNSADLRRELSHPPWTLTYTTGMAVLGVLLTFVLVPSHRAPRAALAFFLALILVTLPFLLTVSWRLVCVSPAYVMVTPAPPALACLGAGVAFNLLARHLGFLPALASRTVVTLPYAGRVGVLASHERQALRRPVSRH